jgi:hypothetical protein
MSIKGDRVRYGLIALDGEIADMAEVHGDYKDRLGMLYEDRVVVAEQADGSITTVRFAENYKFETVRVEKPIAEKFSYSVHKIGRDQLEHSHALRNYLNSEFPGRVLTRSSAITKDKSPIVIKGASNNFDWNPDKERAAFAAIDKIFAEKDAHSYYLIISGMKGKVEEYAYQQARKRGMMVIASVPQVFSPDYLLPVDYIYQSGWSWNEIPTEKILYNASARAIAGQLPPPEYHVIGGDVFVEGEAMRVLNRFFNGKQRISAATHPIHFNVLEGIGPTTDRVRSAYLERDPEIFKTGINYPVARKVYKRDCVERVFNTFEWTVK